MKKVVKKLLYVFSIVILAVVAVIIYDEHFSPAAILGKENLSNARNLQVGMNENSVIEIMGKPNAVEQTDKSTKFYRYTSNNSDYLDIEVYFNEKGNISRIFLPEN
jgi:hypothetical protein